MATAQDLRILGIGGSLRRGSYNRKLLREAARIAPDGMNIRLFEGMSDIPLFNEDVEAEGYPEAVQRLHLEIAQADGILLAVPEYNYGATGVLKNAIDWASRPAGKSPLNGKPAAVMGASPGMGGTARAQLSIRDSFVFTQTPVLPGPEVLVFQAHEQFDEKGQLIREDTRDFLRGLLERFGVFVRRFQEEPVGAGVDSGR